MVDLWETVYQLGTCPCARCEHACDWRFEINSKVADRGEKDLCRVHFGSVGVRLFTGGERDRELVSHVCG